MKKIRKMILSLVINLILTKEIKADTVFCLAEVTIIFSNLYIYCKKLSCKVYRKNCFLKKQWKTIFSIEKLCFKMQKQYFTSKKKIVSSKLTVFYCFLKIQIFFLSTLEDILYCVIQTVLYWDKILQVEIWWICAL